MKTLNKLPLVASLLCVFVSSMAAHSAEDWKGSPSGQEVTVGALAGLGLFRGDAALGLLGNVAKKVAHEGFVPDINDQAWIEAEIGPEFLKGSTVISYSAHLRWDFQQNDTTVYFAFAGVGGAMAGASLGKTSEVYPRVGLGMLYFFQPAVAVRAEVSHEFTGAGLAFAF